jgi:heat shock protein HslJ
MRSMRTSIVGLGLALGALLAVSGVRDWSPFQPWVAPPTSSPIGELTAGPVPTVEPATSELAGTTWLGEQFWSGGLMPVAQPARGRRGLPSISFTPAGFVGGFDSCNQFAGGRYEVRAGRGLTINPGGMTQRLCDGEVDGRFGEILADTAGYRIEAGRLHLFNRSGRPLMSLRLISSVYPPPIGVSSTPTGP